MYATNTPPSCAASPYWPLTGYPLGEWPFSQLNTAACLYPLGSLPGYAAFVPYKLPQRRQ